MKASHPSQMMRFAVRQFTPTLSGPPCRFAVAARAMKTEREPMGK
jgi:hypothetical protein